MRLKGLIIRWHGCPGSNFLQVLLLWMIASITAEVVAGLKKHGDYHHHQNPFGELPKSSISPFAENQRAGLVGFESHEGEPRRRHHRHHQDESNGALGDEGRFGCQGEEEAREKRFMRECHSSLRQALMKYSKLLKEEEDDAKVATYDLCGSLESIFNCSLLFSDDVIKHCVSRDKSTRKKMETFTILMEHFAEVCAKHEEDKHAQSRELQACFREEYRGTLSIRCDEYYEFNVAQGTKDQCYFLREKFKCHESLLDSSCCPSLSLFNFHFLSIISERQLSKLNCSIVRDDPNFYAFKYDNKACKRGIIRRLEWCTSTHLDSSLVLKFSPDNDLVAMGGSRSLMKFCGAYDGFKKCILPMNETCPRAVDLFLQYESTLHQYILKMDFICSQEMLPAYSSNLKCLRSTLSEKRLNRCEVHWHHFTPHLDNLSSVEFFCTPHKPAVMKITKELANIHSCHKEVFAVHCGSEAGDIVDRLLRLVLSDPLYLRFGYKPNCSLHGFRRQEDMNDSLENSSDTSSFHSASNSDDDDLDGVATSGLSEHDQDHVIVTSLPSREHHVTPGGRPDGLIGSKDPATLVAFHASEGRFHDNPGDVSTTGVTETYVMEDIFFPGETLTPREGAVDFHFLTANRGDRFDLGASFKLFFLCFTWFMIL